jgi:hypothetical protein
LRLEITCHRKDRMAGAIRATADRGQSAPALTRLPVSAVP